MGYSKVSPSKLVTESELNHSRVIEYAMPTTARNAKTGTLRVPVDRIEGMSIKRVEDISLERHKLSFRDCRTLDDRKVFVHKRGTSNPANKWREIAESEPICSHKVSGIRIDEGIAVEEVVRSLRSKRSVRMWVATRRLKLVETPRIRTDERHTGLQPSNDENETIVSSLSRRV